MYLSTYWTKMYLILFSSIISLVAVSEKMSYLFLLAKLVYNYPPVRPVSHKIMWPQLLLKGWMD